MEIADRVVDVLESLGYRLLDPKSDAVYESSDQRNAFVVKVKQRNQTQTRNRVS